MEIAPPEMQLDEQTLIPTEKMTDLSLAAEQTEEIKGGLSCQNNLKQIGLAAHNYN